MPLEVAMPVPKESNKALYFQSASTFAGKTRFLICCLFGVLVKQIRAANAALYFDICNVLQVAVSNLTAIQYLLKDPDVFFNVLMKKPPFQEAFLFLLHLP
jgi:hypothetical protein